MCNCVTDLICVVMCARVKIKKVFFWFFLLLLMSVTVYYYGQSSLMDTMIGPPPSTHTHCIPGGVRTLPTSHCTEQGGGRESVYVGGKMHRGDEGQDRSVLIHCGKQGASGVFLHHISFHFRFPPRSLKGKCVTTPQKQLLWILSIVPIVPVVSVVSR